MAVIVGPTSWQFGNRFPLGEPTSDGGNTICISGGIVWIVAPASSEVSRNWHDRNDAVTTATNCTSATGWFVPTCYQLQNPGYECRTYWDSYSCALYFSSTPCGSSAAWGTNFSPSYNGDTYPRLTSAVCCVRAFRCVCY